MFVRGCPEALVSAVVGTTDANDAEVFFRNTSASGVKKVLTLVWSMAWDAGKSRFPRNSGDLNFAFLQGTAISFVVLKVADIVPGKRRVMMTRSNSPVSDLLGAAPGSARSAPISPVVGEVR